jgi:maltooligosyltrehalose trehalohydrolase
VTEGRRREFAAFSAHLEDVPDPQAPETFERSRLNWNERTEEPHFGLLDWHRRLIRLRREVPALSDGRLERVEVTFDETARWFVVRRGSIVVACNLSASTRLVPAGIEDTKLVLASESGVKIIDGQAQLPPDSVAIVSAPTNTRS